MYNKMREISRNHYIVSRRTLNHQCMVDREKFPLSDCSACPDHPYGSGRQSKPRYRQRTPYFPPNRSTLASTFSISSFARIGKRCSASWTQTAYPAAKNQRNYRSHSSHDAPQCDTLEHAHYGQSFGSEQGNRMSDMATTQSQAAFGRNIQTQPRQTICRKASRYRRAISQSSGQSAGFVCRRKKPDSGPRQDTAFITFASRHSGTPDARLYTARNDNFIRRLKHAQRQSHRRLYAQAPASRIYPLLTTHKCQNSAGFGTASYCRQLRCSQTPAGLEVAKASSPVPLAFYANLQFLAQYGGALVPGDYRQAYPPGLVQKRPGFNQSNYAVSRLSQPESSRFHLERIGRTDYVKDCQM